MKINANQGFTSISSSSPFTINVLDEEVLNPSENFENFPENLIHINRYTKNETMKSQRRRISLIE